MFLNISEISKTGNKAVHSRFISNVVHVAGWNEANAAVLHFAGEFTGGGEKGENINQTLSLV